MGVEGTALLLVECNRIQRGGAGEGLKEKGGKRSERQVCILSRDARDQRLKERLRAGAGVLILDRRGGGW